MAPTVEERLRSLKLKRAAFKLELLMFKEALDNCHPESGDVELKNRVSDLATEFATFSKSQGELDAADETGESMKERLEIKNAYLTYISRAQKKLQAAQAAAAQSSIHERGIINSPASLEALEYEVNLPKLHLPQFSGQYEEWPGFADQFKSAVHDNLRLTECKKLMYLRSCLRGEASRVIDSLENSAANYQPAWALLEERYNKPAVIVTNHIRALFNLPHLTKVTHSNLRQFLTDLESHYRALKTLKQPSADTLLIFLCLSRLDQETNLRWKEHTRDNAFPSLEVLCKFLHNRCQDIEPSGPAFSTRQADVFKLRTQLHQFAPRPAQNVQHQFASRPVHNNNYTAQKVHVTTQVSCPLCTGPLAIFACDAFCAAPVSQRIKIASDKRLCSNCLKKGHTAATCNSSGCKVCHKKHNTFLHTDTPVEPQPSTSRVNVACLNHAIESRVILSTAVIEIIDENQQPHRCRVLLDSCAQSNFITRQFSKKLNSPFFKTQIPVTGMNNMQSEITEYIKTRIQSRTTNFNAEIKFLIAKQITLPLPHDVIDIQALQLPKNIPLADPGFHKPTTIDGLLGAQLFWHLLSVGQIKLAQPTVMLRKTLLGWLVVGETPGHTNSKAVVCNLAINSLEKQLARFWELEEPPREKLLSKEEQACQEHYYFNTRRDSESGRYIVRLPFNSKIEQLGESYATAMKRFLSLERALQRNPATREQYICFMREYESLGHMTPLKLCSKSKGYYLPHHAVHKEGSVTSKIRVVFDASAKSSTGVSLNDALMVGPTIQEDLFAIVTRFRAHKYVLTADIAKMYRQIKLAPEDRHFHKILWRENPNDPIVTYILNTVTYGTASASYLAIKSLQQLADDAGAQFPRAAAILKSDFYVDDLLTGANTVEEATLVRDQLIALTKKGGFELRQWSSNNAKLLQSVTTQNENECTNIIADEFKKTLGLYWSQVYDTLGYTVKKHEPLRQVTKRAILSRVAQLFDPLGLLGPVIVKAKILMQRLWQVGVNWDESIPEILYTEWKLFESQLESIRELSIPRRIICDEHVELELHGFCDASEKAYGACIYMRSTNTAGHHFSYLICSKSRVAPLQVQSLPRLELCAAVLLVKLLNITEKSLKTKTKQQILWTDSTIVLHWLKTPPHTLKVFVANRVSEIQQAADGVQWRHVPSQDNPADCLSRGVEPSELKNNNSWFSGPQWLRQAEDEWPVGALLPAEVPELRTVVSLATDTLASSFMNRFSALGRLERTIAYCLRFRYVLKAKQRQTGPLSLEELKLARQRIIKYVQQTEFADDIKTLSKIPHSYKGKLQSLNPFLDENGILRVGGRIIKSNATYDVKHPILIPAKHHFTALVIRHEHLRHFHASVLGTLNAVRQNYWPINGIQAVKQCIRTCVPCYRANPKITKYQMGNLPKDRIIYSRPFLKAGIDYCGPFFIKEKRVRNTKTVKTYIAVFVCFSTKAVHLELVGDLTTDAFLAALKRFFARRGKSSDIYSDNAKTFVGADRELREVHSSFRASITGSVIQHYAINNNITWHFIPPRAPNFGGLWEAAVKQVKRHLIRSVGKTLLTYEAMTTYLAEIEAILNSRPLIPLTSDPNDFTALTPGHFLIGDLITSINESNVTDVPTSRLTMWQHVQQMKQHFWTRWHKDYLHHLTVRRKWHTNTPTEVKEGTLVIVHEDNVPPMCWPLGRIIAVHTGDDSIARVATVKTVAGEYKRSIKRLSPLPMD